MRHVCLSHHPFKDTHSRHSLHTDQFLPEAELTKRQQGNHCDLKRPAIILPKIKIALFAHMDGELLVRARDAKNNAEQHEFFAAMSYLKKAKNTVSQQFTDEVTDQVDNFKDLNARFAVANIISRSERVYQSYLSPPM